MSLKFNFESEEEMIKYLKSNLDVIYDSGYYGDGEAEVKLGQHTVYTKYIPGSGG